MTKQNHLFLWIKVQYTSKFAMTKCLFINSKWKCCARVLANECIHVWQTSLVLPYYFNVMEHLKPPVNRENEWSIHTSVSFYSTWNIISKICFYMMDTYSVWRHFKQTANEKKISVKHIQLTGKILYDLLDIRVGWNTRVYPDFLCAYCNSAICPEV